LIYFVKNVDLILLEIIINIRGTEIMKEKSYLKNSLSKEKVYAAGNRKCKSEKTQQKRKKS
jgi:hypothetical protein